MGNSSAISVLIGSALGAGDLDRARDHCKKLLTLTFGIGFISTAICCLLSILLPSLYNVSIELKTLATRLGCVMAVFSPINFVYAMCFFCLRAGGDTRNAMLLDSGYMWFVPIPAILLMALLFPGKITVLTAVIIINVLTNARIVPALHKLKQGLWLRNVTLDG